MKTIINEDGSFVWIPPKEKINYIKEDLAETLERVRLRVEKNEARDKPQKLNLNTYISTKLFNALSYFPNVPYNCAINIDLETLREYILAFRKLVGYIIDYYDDYVCTKEQFNAFMGISYGAYNTLLISSDADILAEMERLEGFLGEIQLVSAQTGIFKEKSTETRLRADGIGHGMNLKNEEDKKGGITVNVFDPDAINKKLGNIMGKTWLENKK